MHQNTKPDNNHQILVITSEPPWPLNSGGHLRTFHFHNALAKHFNVHIVCPLNRGKTFSMNLPDDAACTIECVTVNDRTLLSETSRILSAQRERVPYSMYKRHLWKPLKARLQQAIKDYDPEFLWFDHIDSFQYHQQAPSGCKTVLDMHNIYSLILFRLADECSNPVKRLAIRTEAKRMEAIESVACRQADVIIAVSASEAAHFKRIGAREVWLAPNGVITSTEQQTIAKRTPHESPVILFLGAMDWQPNISAAKHLANTILPQIKHHYPQAQLILVGKDPVASVRALNSVPGITVTGTVPDIQPYLSKATVMAVPLESGGGTRLKILESFAAGLPVVSTFVGAEGIDAVNGEHLLITELTDMPQAIMSLSEGFLGEEMAGNALKLVNEKYEWSAIAEQTSALLHGLILHSEKILTK